MRVVITGGTGFLGSHVVKALVKRNDQVVLLTRNPCGNLGRLNDFTAISMVLPLSPNGIAEALATGPVDAVIHAAACYGRAGESADILVDANVRLPLALASACGTRIGRWLAVGTALPREISPYALSKAQAADWLRLLPSTVLSPRVHLAFQHFYGPGDDISKFPTFLARRCLAGGEVALTSGIQQRDFLHVTDAASAILTLLDAPLNATCSEVPVGSGTAIPVRELAERINAAAGGQAQLRFGALPTRACEPATCVADPAILHALGWRPRIGLDQGITELVAAERAVSFSTNATKDSL
jgi:nucleoside-diphosphate-sugar epimerase